jgi:AraC-like DNA-binding protein
MLVSDTQSPYQFTDRTHDSFMECMAALLYSNYTDGKIFLPKEIGSGFLRNLQVEEGLSIRNLDFTLAIDFEFVRLEKNKEDENIFQLYYFLNNTDFHFTLGDDKEPLRSAAFSNAVFLSNDMSVNGRFGKNDSVKVIVLSFSLSWLQKNGVESYKWFKPFLSSTESSQGILILENLNMTDYNTASELNKLITPDSEYVFSVKADAFQLIKRFYDAIENRKDMEIHKSRSDYFFHMVKVEHRISEYLTANLPMIKDLSKEFNMSDSNLKRHFRIVYGKNIYEYYLEKKMTLAKEMLLNEGGNVSIVAYALGYQKVSSFSKAFKKIHGVLPSNFKRNGNHQPA